MLPSQRTIARTKVVDLDRGLFLIRYVGSPAPSAPEVIIACERTSERAVTLVSPPGSPAGTLVMPGDALVVQAHRPAQLSVRVEPVVPNGSWEADVSIERLGRPVEVGGDRDVAKSDDEDSRRSNGLAALDLLAHVARLGDISVPAGEWVAGPESPARIEGLAFKWRARSRDLELKYAVRVGGRNSTLMQANGDGSFVGTRGQARPLTEVRFELGGVAAKDHELVTEALFQGATPVRATGRSISLTGPSGREALLGLRVQLVSAAAQQAVAAMKSTHEARPFNVNEARPFNIDNERAGSRVRVFRSSPQLQRG